MKEIYQLSMEELQKQYGEKTGLNTEQVEQRRKKYGENILQEATQKSLLRVFGEQFADLLVLILILAAAISLAAGNVESTVVILAVLFLNGILGTLQYRKAAKSLSALKKLSAPKVHVLRNGTKQEAEASKLVPGDVLLLEAGDLIGADGRILASYSLRVNESALTGEAVNVEKTAECIEETVTLADQRNMVFSGSLVTYGRAEVLVSATGMQTQIGKIAALMNETPEKKTPLQISLDRFSKKLAITIFSICLLVLTLRIWQKEPILDAMMFAVALAVAAIPEALASIVTIVQAIGTGKMAADNAIIKDLKAVESLGCVSVICSDKTGTLTQNKMTVTQLYLNQQKIPLCELDLSNSLYRFFLYNAILNNDSALGKNQEMGDPTETCLLTMARETGLKQAGITEEDIRSMMPRLGELPFDSDRKLMSCKYQVHGDYFVFTKGAVEVLLEKADRIDLKSGIRYLTVEDKIQIGRQNECFSKEGLRVLAFAYRESDAEEVLNEEGEQGFIFTGLAAMMDPPREASYQAVKDACGAGIKTVMITGDHKGTAISIAKQLGIFKEGDLALTGQELEEMREEKLAQVLEKVTVYARVSPENKIRIVEAWQKRGKVTAMTGDGVNDAPALKKADIGVAMGITGTEVSKDAAAMILADDNFATLIKAVLNGRNVYRNIMNAIQFLLSGNMAAILVVVFCSLWALPTPFVPVHLLFINLLTDSLPALAIGMEPSDQSLLTQKPRNPKEGILTRDFMAKLFLYATLLSAAVLYNYFQGLRVNHETASTMAFATLALARLFHGFNCRSQASLFHLGIRSNWWSVAAFFAGVILLGLVLLLPPLQRLFMTTALKRIELVDVVLRAVTPSVMIQLARLLRERKRCSQRHHN